MVGEHRAISTAEKRVWRKLATAAALALAVGFSALPSELNAAGTIHYTKWKKLTHFLSQKLRRILVGQKLLEIQHRSPTLLAA